MHMMPQLMSISPCLEAVAGLVAELSTESTVHALLSRGYEEYCRQLRSRLAHIADMLERQYSRSDPSVHYNVSGVVISEIENEVASAYNTIRKCLEANPWPIVETSSQVNQLNNKLKEHADRLGLIVGEDLLDMYTTRILEGMPSHHMHHPPSEGASKVLRNTLDQPRAQHLFGLRAQHDKIVSALKAHRYVEVVGGAGEGKTDVARAAAATLWEQWQQHHQQWQQQQQAGGMYEIDMTRDSTPRALEQSSCEPDRHLQVQRLEELITLAIAGKVHQSLSQWSDVVGWASSLQAPVLLVFENAERGVTTDASRFKDMLSSLHGSGGPSSQMYVMLVSREPLALHSSLQAVTMFRLQPLSLNDAIRLLEHHLGGPEPLAGGDRACAEQLVRLVNSNPLMLTVAAGFIRDAGMSWQEAVQLAQSGIAGIQDPLDVNDEMQRHVAVMQQWLQQRLPDEHQVFLANVSILSGSFRSKEAAVAQESMTVREARGKLAALVKLSLVMESGDGRYQVHDIVRTAAASYNSEELLSHGGGSLGSQDSANLFLTVGSNVCSPAGGELVAPAQWQRLSPRPLGLSRPPQSPPQSVHQSVPKNPLQSVPKSVPKSPPQSVHQSPPQNVHQSVPKNPLQSVPKSVPRSVHQSPPQSVHQNVPKSPPQSVHQSPPQSVPKSPLQSVTKSPPQSVHQSVPKSPPQSVHQSPPQSVHQSVPKSPPQSAPKRQTVSIKGSRRKMWEVAGQIPAIKGERWKVLEGPEQILISENDLFDGVGGIGHCIGAAPQDMESFMREQPYDKAADSDAIGPCFDTAHVSMPDMRCVMQRQSSEFLQNLSCAHFSQLDSKQLSWLSSSLSDLGQYHTAQQLEEHLVDVTSCELGAQHPDTLRVKANLASTYRQLHQLERARELQHEVLAARAEALLDEHPYTLAAKSNLAATYRQLGDQQRACELQEEVLEASTSVSGPEHPATLQAKAALAATYRQLGDLQRACVLEEQLLMNAVKALGAEHPDTLAAKGNLAVAYRQLGDPGKACDLQKEVLVARVKVLGPDHPDTLSARGNLAVAYQQLGELEVACELQEEVHVATVKVWGCEHPDTLRAKSNLADAYKQLGKLQSACELQEEVLAVAVKVLGASHQDVLSAKADLAGMYKQLGKLQPACKLQEEVLTATESMLGPEHPDSLTAKSDLARILRQQGKLQPAADLQEVVLAARVLILGSEHPDTLTAKSNLALTYQQLGKLSLACALQQEVLEATARLSGAEQLATLSAKNNLAVTYLQLGKVQAACELQEEVLAVSVQVLGGEHPDTLRAKNNLAAVYRQLGRLQSAGELGEEVLAASLKVLGPEHPDTLRANSNLAATHQQLSRLQPAAVPQPAPCRFKRSLRRLQLLASKSKSGLLSDTLRARQ